jgi:hypothetical protein
MAGVGTDGCLVVVIWSAKGNTGARKAKWTHLIKRWSADRLGKDSAWIIPAGIPFREVREEISRTMARSDRAIVSFPWSGKTGNMRVHNLRGGPV